MFFDLSGSFELLEYQMVVRVGGQINQGQPPSPLAASALLLSSLL